MVRTRLGRSAVALTAGLALAASACGVQAGPGTASGTGQHVVAGSFTKTAGARVLARAATTTSSVTSMRVAMEQKTEGSGLGSFSVSATGEFDNQAKKGHLTLDMGGVMGGAGGSFEEIVVGDAIYLKSPLLGRLGGSDKPWLKADISRFAGSRSTSGFGMNPGGFLDFLKEAGSTVTTVGTEKVRGVTTTHVKSTIDLTKVLAKSAARHKKLEAELDGLGASSALRSLPVEAWIDEDGYVRKLVEVFDIGSGTKAGSPLEGLKLTSTIELYDFNQPVTVTVPPKSEVGTFDPHVLGGN